MKLKPFFTFFGGKWRAAPKYPAPRYQLIVEPFAGAAGYSVRHHEHDVVLVEKDPVIAGLWKYLIQATSKDILALPLEISDLREMDLQPAEKALIGFWLNKGHTMPCNIPGKWMRDGTNPNSFWGEKIRRRIADQVGALNHWRCIEGDYTDSPDSPATWFVDPPYVRSGSSYKFSSKDLDYETLSLWCRSLSGQVIVCEQEGASWLPFCPLGAFKSLEGPLGKSVSKEVIWTNECP